MPPLTADVEQAARRVAADSVPPEVWNPVYRALAPTPQRAPARTGQDEPRSDEILRRHVTSPALLVVATTEGASTSRLRIGLHPDTATIETSRDHSPSTWAAVSRDRVPALIEELLAPVGLAGTAPHLGVRRESAGLRLTPGQIEQVRHELSRGTAPPEAFAAADRIDAQLLDALTADGARAAVSLTLHDPSGRHLQVPRTSESWSRVWVRGERSLYRMDDTQAALGPVHPVADGDVLGTVLPVLQEGLRFSAACSVRTGAR